MIIWTRWGILVVVFGVLSLALGFGLKALLAPAVRSNSLGMSFFMGLAFLIGAAALWAFAKYVLPRMDKARPLWVTEKLPEPIVNEHGAKVTHRQVPVVNQETGQQVYAQPSSSLFFIPVRFWPYILGAFGVVNTVIGVIGVTQGNV